MCIIQFNNEYRHRDSSLPVHLAITEAIRMHKPDLNKILIKEQDEKDSDTEENDDENDSCDDHNA